MLEDQLKSVNNSAAESLSGTAQRLRRPFVASLTMAAALMLAACRGEDSSAALRIAITDPKPNQSVGRVVEVAGRINRPKSPDESIVLLVRDLADRFHYHPQLGVDAQGRSRRVQFREQDWTGIVEITDKNVHLAEINAVWLDRYGGELVDQYEQDSLGVGRWSGILGGIQRGALAEDRVVVNIPLGE